ncbi:MAG: TetR/AcrR family transcriptional regulator [Nocardioidaceae bacterium]|nr:TetR/AcrR family transcriptional regulator [Nocardioidaceae bacterium]
MARDSTRSRVHAAVLLLVMENGYGQLTMEGIASRAGVSKQTLYRTWPSRSAVLFDALLGRSGGEDVEVPDTGDLAADLEALILATVEEMTDPPMNRLLRAVTADIQSDDPLASELSTRLLAPQLDAVTARVARAGITDPEEAVELLYGAVLHRWLLRTRPFTTAWVKAHVARTLRAFDRH